MKKYTLYLGLNDSQSKSQTIPTEDAVNIVTALLIDEYQLAGATLQLATGIYKHDDGSIIKENTIIIILLDIDDSIINEIIDDLKIIFNQECILKEVCLVDYIFM